MNPATDGPQQLRNRFSLFRTPEFIESPEPTDQLALKAGQRWGSLRAAMLVVVLLGVILRAVPLIQNRCLWIDEAMLALNLVDRSPSQLLQPLDWNQGAPAGFLLLVKAAISVVGPKEWGLRLVPFTASIFGLFGFAWLSRRILAESAALLATALFAISPTLISYTAECKQYESDAVITTGILAASIGLLARETGARRWLILGVAGAIAVWFSHPVVFVLSSLGCALFLDSLVMGNRRRALACAGTIGTWLTSFALCYFLTLRHLGHNRYLLDYWAGQFLTLPPTSAADLAWLVGHLSSFVDFPGGLGGTEVRASGLAAAFFLIGIGLITRKRWTFAAAIVGPACFALLASGIHKYPFAGRLLLFVVPLLLLGVARGAWAVVETVRTQLPAAGVVVLALLLAAPAIETYQEIRRPLRHEQITEILEDVRQRWQPGDKVYLYYGAVPAYLFYTREHPFVPDVVLGTEFRSQRTGYRDELRKLAGEPRVWVIFSHRHQAEESLLQAYSEGLGECREEIRRPGASAFLFDMSSSSK